MPFSPPPGRRAKERILGYGYMGSGKTFGWTETAAFYRSTDTPGTFYVISTEFQAAERALEPYPDSSNVTIFEALDWDELVTLTAEVHALATEDDWLVVDSIGNAWQFVQDDYVEKALGTRAKRYLGELEKSKRMGESEIVWQVVNDDYRQWFMPHVLRFPGHLYAASQGAPLAQIGRDGKDRESRESRELYGRVGVKPEGQKHLGYNLHTVLMFDSPRKDAFDITTVDDHTRKPLDHEPAVNFPVTYLMGVAGWEMT